MKGTRGVRDLSFRGSPDGSIYSLKTFRWKVLPGIFEYSTVRESVIATRVSNISSNRYINPLIFLFRSRSFERFKVFVSMKLPQ